ncbi:S1/P1 nuclease [Marinoscillum sp. MHG1-6]|uniref:S1/P1 nuclease n=1 Tax=Marinoscillum sp. MHG1-6 TaxID=2959627 RepID=UPI0021574F0B|nr:S1/P1 nuclease [Marinoscillum sp. MHG1-6]
MLRRLNVTLVFLFVAIKLVAWGNTGHRIVGLIAEQHVTQKAKRHIEKIIGPESLAEVSTYMDFIRSDRQYDYMNPWHYATIPEDMTYEEVGTPDNGDVIATLKRLISELETKQFAFQDEAFALKCLIHLVGDIHQPLHVGNGIDKGGNEFELKYFGKTMNLHRVWDSEMIDGQQYSYSEYANWINHPSGDQIKEWQGADILNWAKESKGYRAQVYEIPESRRIGYEYNYKNLDLLNLRLLQAGVRLAGILNQIYG